MPLYEYQCCDCRKREEKVEGFDADVSCPCSTCGSVMVRMLSAPAIRFKGAGFYVNDYGRKEAES